MTSELSFVQMLRTVTDTVPDRTAIAWRDETVTFEALMQRADNVAQVLAKEGLRRHPVNERERWRSDQEHVAIVMRNRPEWLEAMVGSFAAGTVPVNVNYRYVAHELLQLFTLTRPKVVFYENTFAAQLELVRDQLEWSPLWVHVDDDSGAVPVSGSLPFAPLRTAVGAPVAPPTSPDDLYILCTGGTTGLPKAVLWRQSDVFVAAMGGRDGKTGAAIETIEDVRARIRPSVRASFPAVPLMHGAGQWNALSNLFAGQTVVLSGVLDHLDADDIWRNVERHRVHSLIIAGNAFARPMLEALDRNATYDLSSLRVILSGAIALSTDLKRALLDALPGVTIFDAAGASESGTALVERTAAGEPVVSGTFQAGAGTVILGDDRTTTIEPPDPTVGWLARAGCVPLGYLDDPERTRETFPEIGGVRYSVPGDRARWTPEGEIELLGRDSMTINSGGEKIFAEEVEGVIAEHPAVYDVLVVGRPSERWGQEIVAVVQLRAGASTTIESIRDAASRDLARYKLPKDVVFVDEMKRTPAGKADYVWAQAIAREHAPEQVQST
jgi:acyl-CoA synthetase (AMP-forming)/AMP-acid ligase II